jgi:hypothetical protein
MIGWHTQLISESTSRYFLIIEKNPRVEQKLSPSTKTGHSIPHITDPHLIIQASEQILKVNSVLQVKKT